MTSRTQKYSIFLDIDIEEFDTRANPIAMVALREENGVLEEFAFRYSAEYLSSKQGIPLDPVAISLQKEDIFLNCRSGGIPGILDDYLPDDWGRRVLTQLSFYKTGKRFSSKSPIDQLSLLGSNRIGAVKWANFGELPKTEDTVSINKIREAESLAQNIESGELPNSIDEYSLIYLANCGTGVGGARPKALIEDESTKYLAKFNRLTQDTYNNARVELACLNMAMDLNLTSHPGKIIDGINGREVLLLERFDINGNYRNHLVTVNALLKMKENQCDRGGAFRYDDVADLIKKYSIDPIKDLEQLFKLMLFNVAINNTDDHERNFSFIANSDGYTLSPAYDMVPSLSSGQYHVAGFGYSVNPPRPSEIKTSEKYFGLPKTVVKNSAEHVSTIVNNFEKYADNAGVSAQDFEVISKAIKV